MNLPVTCARLRMPLLWIAVALLVVDGFVPRQPVLVVGLVALAIGLACYLRLGTMRRDPVTLALPVTGRWVAVNSPADRIPSHGMHAYGQTYAIDLVYQPLDHPRPGFGWWPLARRPREFPGFGRPVLAPAAGVVVGVHDRERDHWSRTSWPALVYLLAEGVRELLGPSRILGNHVVLDLGNGVYAAFAHLRRRSITVRKGQRVAVGEQIGACGNSGNSTEPHLHFQLMDHPSVLFAAGLPAQFDRFEIGGVVQDGMPHKGQPFEAAGPDRAAARAIDG